MKASDRYETPPHVYEAISKAFGPFDLDVCATHKTKKCELYFGEDQHGAFCDAFPMDWAPHRCWLNPPYSDPMPWIVKAIREAEKGAWIVALLPSDTSTQWYQLMRLNPNVDLHHPYGRIRFLLDGVEQGSPKFGSVIAVFHPALSLKRPKPVGIVQPSVTVKKARKKK